jgi:pantothenate kinase
MESTAQLDRLIQTIDDRVRASDDRLMVGIVGAPGSGKSTVAEYVCTRLAPGTAVIVPMDGFHLANTVLDDLGRSGRKGAIDTFDAGGYVSLLRRLRARDEDIVYAPEYRREIEESVGSAIPVPAEVPVIITEGNYLLAHEEPWVGIREVLDETWFIEVAQHARMERLIARHVRFGKSPQAAAEWAGTSDEANARFIATTAGAADVIVRLP